MLSLLSAVNYLAIMLIIVVQYINVLCMFVQQLLDSVGVG